MEKNEPVIRMTAFAGLSSTVARLSAKKPAVRAAVI